MVGTTSASSAVQSIRFLVNRRKPTPGSMTITTPRFFRGSGAGRASPDPVFSAMTTIDDLQPEFTFSEIDEVFRPKTPIRFRIAAADPASPGGEIPSPSLTTAAGTKICLYLARGTAAFSMFDEVVNVLVLNVGQLIGKTTVFQLQSRNRGIIACQAKKEEDLRVFSDVLQQMKTVAPVRMDGGAGAMTNQVVQVNAGDMDPVAGAAASKPELINAPLSSFVRLQKQYDMEVDEVEVGLKS